MSMDFYTYREGATRPLGAHGPVDEDTAIYCPWQHTLDPTDEQVLAAGWCYGPNVSNGNAPMVLRSLGLDEEAEELARESSVTLDPADVKARILRCQFAGSEIADDGQPNVEIPAEPAYVSADGELVEGRCAWTECGVPAGYFADRHAQILEVCDQALAWGTDLIVA